MCIKILALFRYSSSYIACVSYGFTELHGVCFLLVTAKLPWSAARQSCINMGADLITFSSNEQFSYFEQLLATYG